VDTHIVHILRWARKQIALNVIARDLKEVNKMCELIGDCEYQEGVNNCSHWDGSDCRNGERLAEIAEHARDLKENR